MSYVYAKDNGRILYAEDGQKNRSVYEYTLVKNSDSTGGNSDGGDTLALTAVTTFAGGRIQIQMEKGRLVKLTDALGRTVTYTYDKNGYLVCVNQNDRGLTRYVYDKKGNITEITDQNNKRYTMNTFDDKGRDEQGFLIKASEGGSVYQYERDTEGNTLKKTAFGRSLYEAAYYTVEESQCLTEPATTMIRQGVYSRQRNHPEKRKKSFDRDSR